MHKLKFLFKEKKANKQIAKQKMRSKKKSDFKWSLCKEKPTSLISLSITAKPPPVVMETKSLLVFCLDLRFWIVYSHGSPSSLLLWNCMYFSKFSQVETDYTVLDHKLSSHRSLRASHIDRRWSVFLPSTNLQMLCSSYHGIDF